MSIPTISPLSPAPNRQTSSRTQFAIDVDRRLSEENRLTVEANALAEWMNERAADVGQGASSVTADKQAAAVSAASAATARTQAQAAASASDSAAAANTSRTQAQTAATSAAADAQRAKDAADRAEAIVGPVGTAASKDAQTSTADTTPNRLMLVGAGGLLSEPEVLAGSWNDLGGMTRFVRGNTSIVTDGPVTTNQWLTGFFISIGSGVSGVLTCSLITFNAQRNFTRLKINGVWQAWVEEFNTSNQFALGATRSEARTALGITDGPGRVPAENNIGNVATSAAQTVNIDVAAHESSSMSMEGANTTGALTINFTNIPSTTNGTCVWYVDVARAGRKTINFTLPAGNTLRWAGGAVPVLSNTSGWRSQIMFEKKLGLATVYASVVREGLFT